MKSSTLLLASGALALLPAGHAATLVNFDFGTTYNASLPQAYTSVASGLVSTSLSQGSGFSFKTATTSQATAGAFTGAGLTSAITNAGVSATSFALAQSGAEYLEFTLTPDAGQALSFGASDSLTFGLQVRYTSTATSGSTTVFAGLATSLDSYASQVGDTVSASVTGGASALSGFVPVSVSLASLTPGAAAGAPITFRVYLYLSGSTGSTRFVDMDNLVVNGSLVTASSPVPEPASAATLAGLAVLSGVAFARRRRR